MIGGEGVELAARKWPGAGSATLAMAHATGFCKEVWNPVVEELRHLGNTLPIVAWDQRSHGASSRSSLPIDWWDLAEDVLAVRGRVDGSMLGIGHSSGAAALLMAEIIQPGAFDLIVAIEPVVFPPPYGAADDHPLTLSARRRRDRYSSPQEARANFVDKDVFAGWDSRALDGYIAGGLRSSGDEWELACSPEHEASFYAGAGTHKAWDRLGEVETPLALVIGADSDTCPPALVEALEAQFSSVETIMVEGAGHFLPMEDPARLATIVEQIVTDSTTSS